MSPEASAVILAGEAVAFSTLHGWTPLMNQRLERLVLAVLDLRLATTPETERESASALYVLGVTHGSLADAANRIRRLRAGLPCHPRPQSK